MAAKDLIEFKIGYGTRGASLVIDAAIETIEMLEMHCVNNNLPLTERIERRADVIIEALKELSVGLKNAMESIKS